jgi:hypothetical protein
MWCTVLFSPWRLTPPSNHHPGGNYLVHGRYASLPISLDSVPNPELLPRTTVGRPNSYICTQLYP